MYLECKFVKIHPAVSEIQRSKDFLPKIGALFEGRSPVVVEFGIRTFHCTEMVQQENSDQIGHNWYQQPVLTNLDDQIHHNWLRTCIEGSYAAE